MSGLLEPLRSWRYVRPLPSGLPKSKKRGGQKEMWCGWAWKVKPKLTPPSSVNGPKYHRLVLPPQCLDTPRKGCLQSRTSANRIHPFKAKCCSWLTWRRREKKKAASISTVLNSQPKFGNNREDIKSPKTCKKPLPLPVDTPVLLPKGLVL